MLRSHFQKTIFAFNFDYLPRFFFKIFFFAAKENLNDAMKCVLSSRRGTQKEIRQEAKKASGETFGAGDAGQSEDQSAAAAHQHALPVQVLHHRHHLIDTERR